MKKIILAALLAASFIANADWVSYGRTAQPDYNVGSPNIQFFEQRGYGEYATIGLNVSDDPIISHYYDIRVDGNTVEYIPCEEGCGATDDAIIKMSTVEAMMRGQTLIVETDNDRPGKARIHSLKGSAKALKKARQNRYRF